MTRWVWNHVLIMVRPLPRSLIGQNRCSTINLPSHLSLPPYPPCSSVIQRERGETGTTGRIPTNIPPRLGVGWMVALERIKVSDAGVGLRHVSVNFVNYHAFGDVVGELFDLLSDVAEEGIAGPAAQHHDGVDGDFAKVHSHCCPGSQ